MTSAIDFTDIFHKTEEPLTPRALLAGSGRILVANEAMERLLKFFPQDHSIFHLLEEIHLADFFRKYLQKPVSVRQAFPFYAIALCPYGVSHLLTLVPLNKRPSSETVLRRLIHDLKTPLSTALMAVSNLDFVLEQETQPTPGIDFTPKEFTLSATQALQDIKEQLELIGLLIKRKTNFIQRSDFIDLLFNVSLPVSLQKDISLKRLLLPIQPKAVDTALRLLLNLPSKMALEAQRLSIRLRDEKAHHFYRLEITNLAADNTPATFMQPLSYADVPENIQIQLAIAEYLLLKNDLILTGTLQPEKHIFNLIIFIPVEEQ